MPKSSSKWFSGKNISCTRTVFELLCVCVCVCVCVRACMCVRHYKCMMMSIMSVTSNYSKFVSSKSSQPCLVPHGFPTKSVESFVQVCVIKFMYCL